MNRLSFGIKTAPSEFNRIIDQILSGLNKTLAYFDDIIVHGSTKEECQQNLYACLQRLKEYDLHLNKSKCLFFQEEIEYLGHNIGFNKISKSPKKIEAIINMPRPSNVGDVRRFLGFDYEVEYKKGSENINVDCLSRAPVDQKYYSTDIAINEEVHQLCYLTIFEISSENITAENIIQETDKDETLSKIKRKLLSEEADDIEYTLEAGILFKGQRVVIPKILQPQILEELHKTHVGITKMKQLARRYCIWKGIDRDIERMVKSCQNCAEVKTSPAKAPLHQWEQPTSNWNRIHIDYAGPFENHYFLVVVDARSKWAEIRIIKEAPTSEKTIELLKDIFSIHGFPDVMVSDNATIFVSEIFKQFSRESGIFQKFIAPGHPATNGLAERNIQTLKQRLKSMKDENLTLNQKVREILFRYRATPLACGKSPAELYLHRAIRIKLDALKPCKKTSNYQKIPGTRNLPVGERVQARYYTNLKPTWKFGTVIRTWSTPLSYQIRRWVHFQKTHRSITQHGSKKRRSSICTRY
ncbi:uncharacterized protein K02A2.6-like [Solenopsis invicta]|uniref:uncharacterized protein K02A2.6-like n=1 Tax=Solenopsis invicta TaxID=13686 RepID=UPI00193DC795|nr:uncharacterized protein K02A2.6-like [Solenopsis invicta]XP_039305141.1 uncharacterized protein K02A2.6-like [Solenopsis invicta]XP_039305269.1 uncharacterized protein K02A2.6-like [Solenopsis invicta]